MKVSRWLGILLASWLGLAHGAAERPLLRLENPVVLGLAADSVIRLRDVLVFQLERGGKWSVPPDACFQGKTPRCQNDSASVLHWQISRRDSVYEIWFALQGPSSDNDRHSWHGRYTARLSMDELAIRGAALINGNADSSAMEPAPPRVSLGMRLIPPLLFWGTYGLVAYWQEMQAPANHAAQVSVSPEAGGSGAAGWLAGIAPYPAIRGVAGAGVARNGTSYGLLLNPAATSRSPNEISFAGGALPGGATEFVAIASLPVSAGVRQGYAIRSEGDSLAQYFRFSGNYALDFGYWYPWLAGMHAGIAWNASTFALGDPNSSSDMTGYGQGLGFDLGMQWLLMQDIRLGLVCKNLIAADRATNTATHRAYWERIPTQIVAGFAWSAPYESTILADWISPAMDNGDGTWAIGVEKTWADLVVLRGGYRTQWEPGTASWHAGLGAHAQAAGKTLYLEYALDLPQGAAGWTSTRQTAGTRVGF